MTVDEALRLPRVAIAGGPRTGKTTLAEKITDGRPVVHTDDFIQLGNAGLGAIIADALAETQTFALEGVKAANALRAGLRVDVAIWLNDAKVELSDGQATMAKGVQTVFDEWVEQDGGKTPILFG